jgi:FKBP-type peptidyl-prolyl cis-trans isomerases 2
MTFNRGDYILLDYTVIVKDDNKVIETTNEATAKEAGIYRPEDIYEPRLVILGETKLWEPLESALLNAEEGKDLEVEIPPEKAYGQRDLGKIKTLSIREFHRHGIVPHVDDVVEIEGSRARVISISGGRRHPRLQPPSGRQDVGGQGQGGEETDFQRGENSVPSKTIHA